MRRALAFVTAIAVSGSFAGCWRHPGLAFLGGALLGAAIVSSVEPPPPRVIYVPPPRDGYVWQSGYWTRQDGNWVWMDGGWVEARPQMQYVPTHWQQSADGNWQLVTGQWVPVG
jgi:hypothetical protein